jgi:hypothetical protein
MESGSLPNTGGTDTGTGASPRERIREGVLPTLGAAISDARDTDHRDRETLDEIHRAALVLCYRLLFLAVAERAGALPDGAGSLTQTVRGLDDGQPGERGFDETSFGLWTAVTERFRAVHEGDADRGVPACGGWLLSPEPDVSPTGALLADLCLDDAAFGPVLATLFPREPPGSDLDVRTLGRVHEALLSTEFSVADRPLGTDDGRYVPVDPEADPERVAVEPGELYLHGQSGQRKATGSYYTPPWIVDHLLDHALDPALDDHMERVRQRLGTDGADAAAEALFEFSVADVAMGSGNFLLGAADRVASRFADFLDTTGLPPVEADLEALARAGREAFPGGEVPSVERDRLLHRLVARRCLYGVDRSRLATELARHALWLATFVPGRPLTAFDGTLVTGDALAGVGTLAAAADRLDTDASTLASLDCPAERFDVLAAARVDDTVDVTAVAGRAPGVTDGTAHEHARSVLESTDPVHFPTAFPEVFGGGVSDAGADRSGFDVVVGNPPWEEATLEEDEFWTRHVPGLQGKSQAEREAITARLRAERPDLVARYERERARQDRLRAVLRNGPYPSDGGDPDTYRAFAWRAWQLVADGGTVGLVLPRSAFVAAGSETLRRTLLEEGRVRDLTVLKNRGGWVFEGMEHRYTVALLAAEATPPGPDATLPIRGPYPDRATYERGRDREPHEFPAERALGWTGSASFPVLPPEPTAVAAFERMAGHPPLGRDEPGEWRARPHAELHATNDKTADGTRLLRFVDDPPTDAWPVFKGASIDHWTPDTGVRYAWADPAVVRPFLQERRERSYRYAGSRSAFAGFTEEWVHDPETLPCRGPRVAFRDVTNRTNRRTLIPALVPPETFLTNKAPYLLWPRGDERDEAYLLGVLASLPLDWYARRFVETNLNFHVFEALPVPRPGREDPRRRRVVELAGALAAVDDRYADWATRVGVEVGTVSAPRSRALVHELDAVVAHLYGLSRPQLRAVFRTFHDGWDHGERLAGVLGWYDEWAGRLGEPGTGVQDTDGS